MLRIDHFSSTQRNVLSNIRHYLDIQGVRDAFLDRLAVQGYCFGFSLCRAAMRIAGKLEWWDKALLLIANWDGNVNSLNNQYILPKTSQLISLKEIFERVIPYIVFNQGSNNTYPHLPLRQNNFLMPGHFFEMLDQQEKILKVKENFKIGGHFSQQDIFHILNDKNTQELIQDNLCLIHQYEPSHTYELGYTKGMWSLYCSNFENGYPRYCFAADPLSFEIIKKDRDLIIELACVRDRKESPFSYYYQELMKYPVRLLQGNSLVALAWESPQLLRDLLGYLKPEEYSLINCNQFDGKAYPIHFLVSQNTQDATETITPLCKAGADVNVFSFGGHTPLMLAVDGNNAAAIEVLNKNGADPNLVSRNASLQTALMMAASKSDESVMTALLNNKNINLQLCVPAKVFHLIEDKLKPAFENYCRKYPGNTPYFTALHYAVFLGKEEAANLLLRAMKDVSIETLNELYDLAYILEHKNLVSLIHHHLNLKLNLKRKVESDDEVPRKKAKYSHSFFNENKKEDYEAVEISGVRNNSHLSLLGV